MVHIIHVTRISSCLSYQISLSNYIEWSCTWILNPSLTRGMLTRPMVTQSMEFHAAAVIGPSLQVHWTSSTYCSIIFIVLEFIAQKRMRVNEPFNVCETQKVKSFRICNFWVECCLSSKGVTMAPEVTLRSRDVNKHGGGVVDLINMQMTYLICKWPNS